MGGFGKFRNPRWLTNVTQLPCHVRSSTHDVDLKGNDFRRIIHPQGLERRRGGFPEPLSLVQKVKKQQQQQQKKNNNNNNKIQTNKQKQKTKQNVIHESEFC